MTVLLCILDGFGLREALPDNAVAAANTPTYDRLIESCPFCTLDGSGEAVGLPDRQMGNSEVGHLNLGAGRIVSQDITRIDKAIDDNSFIANEVLNRAMDRATAESRGVHLLGLISDGGVHSSLKHLFALIDMAARKNVSKLYLHAFMDGRDRPPTAGKEFMAQVIQKFSEVGVGEIATVMGRYYGMDRDRRWDRTEKAYQAIVNGQGTACDDAMTAIRTSYDAEITDEFILPKIINVNDPSGGRLRDGDSAIMFNFRADRARQLSYMLVGHHTKDFKGIAGPDIELTTMTQFDVRMTDAKVAFQLEKIDDTLGETLSRAGKRQLRITETEKYAHVTFFFNGRIETPFAGEDRDLIPSPKVATYDLQPEMSSVKVTESAVSKIRTGVYDFVLLNYANCDMVGHTGNFDATRCAVEAVDRGLDRLLAAIREVHGIAIVTADHGNAEMMIDPDSGGPWTAHTTNLVPCLLFDPGGILSENSKTIRLRESGILADIAPTILDMLGISIPSKMTGESLLVRG